MVRHLRRLPAPHPGVDPLADDLGQDAAQDHRAAGQDAQQHQQVVVLVSGALIGQRADARIGEHRLHNIGPPQDVGHGDRHQAQVRGHRPPETVPEQDLPAAEALGLGQQHVVRADLLQQAVADHVGVVPQMARHGHGQGQEQVDRPVRGAASPQGVGPAAGQPPQPDGEHQNQRQGQPELRDAADRRPRSAQEAVQPVPLVPGADRPQRQRAGEDQNEAGSPQEQGVGQAGGDDGQRVRLVLIGDAEVPRQGVLQPAGVLDVDGLGQPQPLLRLGALLDGHFLRPLAVVGNQRVPRGQPRSVKHRQGQEKYAEQEAEELAAVVENWIFSAHAVPSFRKTKWPGEDSVSVPSRSKGTSSKSSSRRARSRRGSGMGTAESRAWV